ncbi:MAG: lipoprotein insertase outer membrane protein LolB [Halioglobus sp.]
MHGARIAAFWLASLLLAGCSGLDGPGPQSATWKEHAAAVAALSHWDASGKLALRNSQAQESAGMQWQQRGRQTQVRLSGPMGVGATEISSDGARLDIRQGEEHRVLDVSSRQAIILNTGWDLPLAALPYWIRGLPEPDSDIQAQEIEPESGLLRTLRQRNWQVRYTDYALFDALMLPTRLTLENGETRATLLIRNWLVLAH